MDHFPPPQGTKNPEKSTSPFHVVLVQPEIPPNTGTIIRLCAATGCTLHLVGPLAFRLDTPSLRRAGMDYRDLAHVQRWNDLDGYLLEHPTKTKRAILSTYGTIPYSQWRFHPGDHLIFGSEGHGLPPSLLQSHTDRLIRIPMTPACRSLNLAVSVGIVLYEALQQTGFPGLSLQRQNPGE